MYMAGKDKHFTKRFGIDDEDVTAKIAKYFGGTMMEARRIMQPPDEAEHGENLLCDVSSDESNGDN